MRAEIYFICFFHLDNHVSYEIIVIVDDVDISSTFLSFPHLFFLPHQHQVEVGYNVLIPDDKAFSTFTSTLTSNNDEE